MTVDFYFNDPTTTDIYTLSLHDALPISSSGRPSTSRAMVCERSPWATAPITRAVSEVGWTRRSEEHTSELQSQFHLVCRLLLEKKKRNTKMKHAKTPKQ